MYTTIENVRTMSWLNDSTNITDANIKNKILRSTSMINSAIWCRYTLPIDYRYKNYLTFEWDSTEDISIDIVINWVTYSISVSNWDSASQIADLFRVAAADSTDFQVDALGFGAQVLIISKTDSDDKTTAYAEVNITSVWAITGITNTIWTRTVKYPTTLEEISDEIATALLFIDVYWIEAQDSGKDWPTRMDRVNETLQKLQWVHESWQCYIIFDDITLEEIDWSTANATTSYPNETSNTDTDDPTAPKTTINQGF